MAERVLMKGNEALAEAAIRAGCRHFFGYPITPQTEINAYMARQMPKVSGTYLQAESELAAINMVLGAAAAGVRAMTSSSSPGISLKTEGISYLAASDLPCLIVNVQRAGPGLGGIRPAQGDYFQATRAPGHGDLRILVLAPGGVQEMVDLTRRAFDLADQYRMPAMILTDGLLGQMMEPITLPEDAPALPPKPWAVTGHENKRPPNVVNSLNIDPEVLEPIVLARFAKYAQIERDETRAELYRTDGADIVLAAFGACARIARSAVDRARGEGIRAGLIRPVTLWPFPKADFARLAGTARCFLTVEMNMGQMVDDVRLATSCAKPVRFYGRAGGMVPTPDEVFGQIRAISEAGESV